MNAEEVKGTTQTKCREGECGECELEEPSAWWIPMTHCSSVFFNPLLLAIDYPTALHVLDRDLRLQGLGDRPQSALDRKSTRLNSSHLVISYAVFCLKKKNNKNRK